MMRCERVQGLLDAYADGELTEIEAKLVANHLRSCHKCQQRLDEVQKLRWLLNDAFADFKPTPSQMLEQRLEQVIPARKLPVRSQVAVRRSHAIFAFTTLVLIWFAAVFLYHQPFRTDQHEMIGAKEIAEPPKPSVSPSQKLERQTEKLAEKATQTPALKREKTLAEATTKSFGRRTEKKPTRVVSKPRQEGKPERIGQVAVITHEPKEESATELPAQPRTLLVRIERIVPANPEEPVPEMFIYRAIDAPFGQGVAVSSPHGAIAQPIVVAEISMSGVQIEHNF